VELDPRRASIEPTQVLTAWAADASLAERLDNGTAVGVFVGDEICCGNFTCVTDVLGPLVAAIREQVGAGPLIYTNECSGTFQAGKTPMMPAELDLVGFDM